ncbi:MAG: hypothetical protein JRJ77_16500 [Deltaproteobacteria bacterium]|nr:hypothetical protein [Deltaproteobacteria bacterium]
MDQPRVKVKIINHPPREETETLLRYFSPEIVNAAAHYSFGNLSFEEQIAAIKKVTKNLSLYLMGAYESQMWLAKTRRRNEELEDIRADYRGNSNLTDEEKSQLDNRYTEIKAKEMDVNC